MSYEIRKSNGELLTIIEDGIVDTTSDLSLVGKNVTNFGQIQNENFVHLLENFSNTEEPSNPIKGQLWYNSSNGSLYVYTGESFEVVGPLSIEGFLETKLKALAIEDTSTVLQPVIQLLINGEILAIFSTTTFTPANEFTGFSKIYRGITLKNFSPTSTDVQLFGRTAYANTSTFANLSVTLSNIDNSTSIATTAFVHNVIPTGVILMWSGSIASIPSGWALCNGANGTPDLREKFVRGASNSITPGNTGGSISATPNILTSGLHSHGTITGNTTLTINQIPSHTHTLPADSQPTGGYSQSLVGSRNEDENLSSEFLTGATGGGLPHNHSITADGLHSHTIDSISILPPWYALCYIMKTV
jgi:microcystin-dependent protein